MPAVELSPDMGTDGPHFPRCVLQAPLRSRRAGVDRGCNSGFVKYGRYLSSSTRLWLKSSTKTPLFKYGERNCRVNVTEVRTVYLTTPRVSTTPTTYMLLDAA